MADATDKSKELVQPRGPRLTKQGTKAKRPKKAKRLHARSVKRRTNLTLDADVVSGVEKYGKRHGTNLSQLVNGFLRAVQARMEAEESPELEANLTPAVRRLYGVAAGGTRDREAHRAHLLEKYGSRR